ncbi:sulfotransferase domain-containing protein [Thiococcus pfennigii]|uniref:sulfotransferase domain-containing protein n=1 Tax=Thiococcus pfennigii TaxID=1057 RepID=UPI0019067D50|nr:sulfotransferase domain-containing protein [Thiococcus pfennigii]MBK1699834.1 hypothetical protein [Thiococcus pfennigii]
MMKPSFFLVGAPKCGTSSLAMWLAQHPKVCFSDPKEPHYFANDINSGNKVTDQVQYFNECFAHCGQETMAAGEGSTWYLYSKCAPENIIRYQKNAKFIIMVRSPIDFIVSLHSWNIYKRYEDEVSLSRAWELAESRRRGRHLPQTCPEPLFLQYRHVGALGSRVQEFIARVPKGSVKLIKLEEMQNRPEDVYLSVLDFLGLPNDGRTQFPRHNVSRRDKITWLRTMIILSSRLKRKLGVRRQLGVLSHLNKLVTEEGRASILNEEFRKYLEREMRTESELIQNL